MLTESANRLRVIQVQYRGADDDSGWPTSFVCNRLTTVRRSQRRQNLISTWMEPTEQNTMRMLCAPAGATIGA